MSRADCEYDAIAGQLAALAAAPAWYVGYSGGLDSTVLLHILRDWCARHGGAPPLRAVHVNHGMQAQAAAWAAHCAAHCAAWGVPLLSRAVSVRGGEAEARTARYGVYRELLRDGGVLFLGHHLDDQVETFFLRLLRGAGVEGLAAMPPQRPLGGGELARPLLALPRAALVAHAQRHELDFVDDPSNSDRAMERNFLRHEVLPLLATRWPAYRRTVSRASEHMAQAADELAAAAGTAASVFSSAGDPGCALLDLRACSEATAARRLRGWLRGRGCRAPDRASLAEFLRQLRAATGAAGARLDCGSYVLQRYREGVYLLPPLPSLPLSPQPFDPAAGASVAAVGRVRLAAAQSGFWLQPGDTLQLRWRRGGERCRLPGRAGRVRLKELLREQRLPPWWRSRVPLLYLGDELLAVAGVAVCGSSRYRDRRGSGPPLWRLEWEPATAALD